MALISPSELQADLAALEAEAMGWLPLASEQGQWAYLHLGNPLALCSSLNAEAAVVTVVGWPDTALAHANVLWMG